ncbi:MAG: hypothetical protein PHU95_02740 [Candidatus Thermoplasmatota archaeon]|nr:hypothetical protein [Candidatus Thermoplasmatota archaeon]MDD5778349.1 hypothetical protein [Candidatus Thermoplasmatota archaeon]
MCSLKLWNDRRGFASWLLSQMGLLLAAGVMMGAIAGVTLYSDWEKKMEASNLASHLATAVECMDLHTFPGKKALLVPPLEYPCRITMSTDYVTVSRSDSLMGRNITARKSLIIRPWVDPPQVDEHGAPGLYNYLAGVCGPDNDGASHHQKAPIDAVERARSLTSKRLAARPFILNHLKPVYIEKAFVHTTEGRKEYVLVYQR